MRFHRRDFLRRTTVLALSLLSYEIFSANPLRAAGKKLSLNPKKRYELFTELSKKLSGEDSLDTELTRNFLEAHLQLYSREHVDKVLISYAKISAKGEEAFATFYKDKNSNAFCTSVLRHCYGALSDQVQWSQSTRAKVFINNPTWTALNISAPGVPMGFASWSELST